MFYSWCFVKKADTGAPAFKMEKITMEKEKY